MLFLASIFSLLQEEFPVCCFPTKLKHLLGVFPGCVCAYVFCSQRCEGVGDDDDDDDGLLIGLQ